MLGLARKLKNAVAAMGDKRCIHRSTQERVNPHQARNTLFLFGPAGPGKQFEDYRGSSTL